MGVDGSDEIDNVCYLILEDVPHGTLIGLDTNVWYVGSSFRGIRNIPLGVHYLFYNSVTEDGSGSGLRCSVFLDFKRPCVLKKCWIRESEEFVDRPVSESDLERLRQNPLEVQRYLALYPKDR